MILWGIGMSAGSPAWQVGGSGAAGMRHGTDDFPRARVRRRSGVSSQAVLCAASLVASASVGLGLLYASAPASVVVALAAPAAPAPAAPAGVMTPLRRAAAALDPSFTAPAFTAGYQPTAFARSVALRASFQPRVAAAVAPVVEQGGGTAEAGVQTASLEPPAIPLPPVAVLLPLPPARPAAALLPALAARPEPTGRRRLARLEAPPAPPSQPDHPGFFERMFGQAAARPGPALAYAAPEAGLGAAGASERTTAVYDIAAHLVTLPDGTRLEAHSGMGANKDDPRSVAEHMRGATPPAVYELTPREALFHGVAALRLTPVSGGNPFGRAGLLAHTYMLGPHGDSNGCVVFRDYKAFRDAYDRGMVRRLMVVARGS